MGKRPKRKNAASQPRSAGARTRPARGGLDRQGRACAAAFFRCAGCDVDARHGLLVVDGFRLEVGSDPWALVVDRFVIEHHLDTLLAKIQEHLAGLAVTLAKSSSFVALRHEGAPLATVAATRARVLGDASIPANYLTHGPHWHKLRAQLDTRLASPDDGLADERPESTLPVVIDRFGQTVLIELPPEASEFQRAEAESASDALRAMRRVAFATPVTVHLSPDRQLEIFPVRNEQIPQVAFNYIDYRHRRPPRMFRGSLRLGTPSGPLALVCVDPPTSPTFVTTAWVTALQALERLTCEEPSSYDTDSPVAELGERSPHDVAGHVRALPPDQQHSADAAREASRHGIELAGDETWVRPHPRSGALDLTAREYSWLAQLEEGSRPRRLR